LPHGVHKGHGLAWLAERLGIEQSRTMGIGDSEADIPMLRWAGLGVAMGNAAPDVKAAADWVAPSLEEDGAAVAIERFVLEETEPSTPAPRPDSVR
jgi:5-amino-6-(5-phospho-D-ribitylamino)uracil phosphatase